MSESLDRNENWVQTWIEEQRAKLRETQQSPGASAQAAHDPSRAASGDAGEFARGMWQFADRFSTPGATGTLPPLGPLREHEQVWRDVGVAAAQYQKIQAELNARIGAAQMAALALLEQRARERSEAQQPLREARELYDLWVECGEETYAQMAHSEEYCQLQAQFANAGIEMRSRQQLAIERVAKQFGLPTRSEVDSLHRQLRELRARMDQLSAASQPVAQPRTAYTAAAAAPDSARAAGPKKGQAAVKKSQSKRPATRRAR